MLGLIYHFFINLNKKTETKVISDEGLLMLSSNQKRLLLRDEVDFYKENGYWRENKLKEIYYL